MMRSTTLASGIFVALSLAGCVKPAPVQFYDEPQMSAGLATISGEKIDPGLLSKDIYSYAGSVDGNLVRNQQHPEFRRVFVTPGPHFLTLACRTTDAYASASVPVEVQAGQLYTAKCDVPPYKLFEQRYAYVWLQDTMGRPVTEKKVAPFTATSTTIIVPMFFHK